MFAEDLRKRLKEEKMTQADLAELVGACKQSVSAWVNGRSCPRDVTLKRITDLLDMPFDKYLSQVERTPNRPDGNYTSNGEVMVDFDKEKLKKERITKQLDRRQLAHMVGVTESTIKNWELGKVRPSINNLELLSNLFNVRIKYWEKEKEYGAFEPKVRVEQRVKEKVDLSENPYRKAQKPLESFKAKPESLKPIEKEDVNVIKIDETACKVEEPFRCDIEIRTLKDKLDFFDERFREFTRQVGIDIDTLTDEIVKKDNQIAELEEKITYLRGLIDGAYTDKSELEGKSWWQRLWA